MEIIFYEIQTAYAADNYDKNKQQPQDVLNMDTFAVLIFL